MRSRWEEKEADRADEPVMITESQLRSLKRGAAIGMAAAILAIVAVGIAGYSLVSARSISSDLAVAAKQPLETTTPAATPDPAAAASATPAAPTTAPAVQPAGAPAQSAAQAPAAAQPVKPAPAVAQTPKPATHKASAKTHRISRIEEKPVTIPAAVPDPTPLAKSAAPSPAIAPQPVAAEPSKAKPAAPDSSAAH